MERQLNDLETHFLDLAREVSLLYFTFQNTKLIQRQPEEGDDNFETLIWGPLVLLPLLLLLLLTACFLMISARGLSSCLSTYRSPANGRSLD